MFYLRRTATPDASISSRLSAMLNGLPHRYEFVFRNPKIDPRKAMIVFQKAISKQRKTLVQKLKNERINAINFRTLRHFLSCVL